MTYSKSILLDHSLLQFQLKRSMLAQTRTILIGISQRMTSQNIPLGKELQRESVRFYDVYFFALQSLLFVKISTWHAWNEIYSFKLTGVWGRGAREGTAPIQPFTIALERRGHRRTVKYLPKGPISSRFVSCDFELLELSSVLLASLCCWPAICEFQRASYFSKTVKHHAILLSTATSMSSVPNVNCQRTRKPIAGKQWWISYDKTKRFLARASKKFCSFFVYLYFIEYAKGCKIYFSEWLIHPALLLRRKFFCRKRSNQ